MHRRPSALLWLLVLLAGCWLTNREVQQKIRLGQDEPEVVDTADTGS